ncbi:MAG: zinc ABC transporter substrate-binding protein [Candidatus Paracaedibacteraceae bacterium]|nr:zinc ABC transporter substrate-binding protein [Candidatus Paracaedibacteraceae bacterium]
MIRLFIIFTLFINIGLCASPKLTIVASFSILGDMIKNVGQDLVDVQVIVPENADPHIYQPTPQDAAILAKADLVIINGLDFEGWFKKLIENSGYKGKIIIAGKNISPRTLPGPDASVNDPHAWHCIKNGLSYVGVISDSLKEALPQKATEIAQNEASYKKKLQNLDTWVRKQFDPIPQAKRIVVTTHDAFWYYGESYGITFLSPVGISTDAEPSALAVARLINEIRTKNIRAVFIESLSSRKLIEEIAKEAHCDVDGVLYADSLSSPRDKNSPAQTYIDMIKHNTLEIIKGLKS